MPPSLLNCGPKSGPRGLRPGRVFCPIRPKILPPTNMGAQVKGCPLGRKENPAQLQPLTGLGHPWFRERHRKCGSPRDSLSPCVLWTKTTVACGVPIFCYNMWTATLGTVFNRTVCSYCFPEVLNQEDTEEKYILTTQTCFHSAPVVSEDTHTLCGPFLAAHFSSLIVSVRREMFLVPVQKGLADS